VSQGLRNRRAHTRQTAQFRTGQADNAGTTAPQRAIAFEATSNGWRLRRQVARLDRYALNFASSSVKDLLAATCVFLVTLALSRASAPLWRCCPCDDYPTPLAAFGLSSDFMEPPTA
jgi:hypothetical protein